MKRVTKRIFGRTADGREVYTFRLSGADGAYTDVTNYGAIWLRTLVPDRAGRLTDVCLFRESPADYEKDALFLGATVGRYANRIKNAAFEWNGIPYALQKNDGENALHGGADFYNKRVWDYDMSDDAVVFRLHSPDGDQGFPGKLDITVTYAFDRQNTLAIDYLAISDKDTPINLTNHAYFNLAGADAGKAGALAHTLRVNSAWTTEIDAAFLPTGRLLPVENTPFDFRQETAIGARIAADDGQLHLAGGYDVNFAVDGEGLREAAVLSCPQNGITLTLWITNPGLQLYSGNMMDHAPRTAICLEPQHYPDSVNQPGFPSSILKAGERYSQRTEYRFSYCATN